MKKGTKAFLILLAVLLAAGGVLIGGLLLPYRNAKSVMTQGDFIIHTQEDGTLELSWPEAEGADSYCVELLVPPSAGEPEKSVYRNYVPGPGFRLPELPQGVELTLTVQPVGEYRVFGTEYIRMGEGMLRVTTIFDAPLVRDQIWDIDTDAKTANVSFHLEPGDRCLCYREENGQQTLLSDLADSPMVLSFGEKGDLPIPELGETIQLDFYGYREIPGLKFYGARSVRASVEREHLLGRSMDLTCEELGDNQFRLTWGEAKGERYEVQLYDRKSDSWNLLAQIPVDGERSFTTPRLAAGRELKCRVITVGGQTLPGSDHSAVSNEVSMKTEPSPVYATVWPVKELNAYRNPDLSESAGTVPLAQPLCVLGETGSAFIVEVDGERRYIDSNYCLINLPEYMGDLCSYNITNSYDSKYMIHEFEIPKVTGRVTKGYEHVLQADGSYLVPLLYPTAKKLVRAAEAAAAEGYRLKIYDAFRPNRATQDIYYLTSTIMDEPLPDLPYTGVSVESLNLPAPKIVDEDEDDDEPGVPILTYHMVMTLNNYELGSFLAPGMSLHNLGIALDLTVEDLNTGEEIPMQTSMHDLSAYSVVPKNNDAAKALAKIMGSAGFGPLFSEWWHFQDNDAKASLSLPAVYPGVSAEGWMADDGGWRYRTENGEYYRNQTVPIGSGSFTFDADGYVIR